MSFFSWKLSRTQVLAIVLALCGLGAASAQTATGDGRGTVAEPTFPAVCTQVPADLTISNGEPSSELNTATDTTALQTALSNASCLGKAVEVTMGSGGQNAMVIAPIAIPAQVTLLVDGGVTLFGSRVASDYQITGSSAVCGSTDDGSGCNALITLGQSTVGGGATFSGTTPTGLMGYGVINGRGYDKLGTISGGVFTPGTSSWWDLAVGGDEDSPILVSSTKTTTAELYKITLLNSPHFHVKIQGQGSTSKPSNITVWGIKLLTPWTPHNTDGIDPTGVVNMTVANSVIGDGDDESAISGSSTSANFTYSNLLLASGHGLSIGSITKSPITNVLVNNANFSGQAADSNEIALRIKSDCGNGGGLVSQVTYQNVCIQNVKAAIEVDPWYSSTTSTTSCPVFASGTGTAPITYQNIFLLTPASFINLQGFSSSTAANVALNNVYVNGSSLSLNEIQSSDRAAEPATPANANITLSGNYFPAGWASLASSANAVTETLNGTQAASFPTSACANAFPTLLGELFASTTTGGVTTNNINGNTASAAAPAAVTIPATVTLNAMVLPTNSEATYAPYTGVPAPTAGVNFYDGSTLVGTGALSANGTLASVTINNPTAGTHVYTAQYAGDSNYAATTLGANTTGTEAQQVTVTVTAGPGSQLVYASAPASSVVYGNGPGTVAVAVEDAAGDATVSTANVTLTVTATGGYLQSYTVAAVNGTATFTGLPAVPVGTYTYTATSTGLTSAAVNESVSPATLTVTASAASRQFGTQNPVFGYTIAGFVNGDTSAVVGGVPALATTALPNSVSGSYPINVGTGTLSATNYVFSDVNSTLTVTGGAAQLITFGALPNFVSGASYQLSATSSSGLAVTYQVSGPATVSGSTITVNGIGLVTVTAIQNGDGDYAAAQSVQRTFVAAGSGGGI